VAGRKKTTCLNERFKRFILESNMPLIVERAYLGRSYAALPPEASRFYISIPASHLSEAYELKFGDKVLGEIIDAEVEGVKLSDIIGQKVEFILGPTGAVYDTLYLSQRDWIEKFREYGIVTTPVQISLKIEEAIRGPSGERIKLYTKRDVKV